ncbi:hypothetical protein AGABI1DRAFT_15026, partial [Agaricus bisporus var. burnettii JB137-S8]
MIRSSPLDGLKIPKLNERLKALLFADDTTVFLSSKDSFDSLVNILDSWCSAAGAKFNKNKTEIIPFGSQEYKNSVRETKRPHAESPMLPDNIKINQEGELTRILGAWFGSQDPKQPWTSIIDRTTTKLHEWRKSSLTLEGTRLVNWMENMSSTQFLTKAQGMPAEVANRFEKMTKEF